MWTADERAHLRDGAEALGVPLSDAQVDHLARYMELLLTWNQKVNLTAVTEPRAIIDKHLLDSLQLVPVLKPALERGSASLLDVGTGPGLPSVVLGIVLPSLAITAVESIVKKAMFVRTVSRELRLPITVEPVRIEQRRTTDLFDIAVSRATFAPEEWAERALPLVREGGLVLAMISEHQAMPVVPGLALETTTEHRIAGAVRRVISYRKSSSP